MAGFRVAASGMDQSRADLGGGAGGDRPVAHLVGRRLIRIADFANRRAPVFPWRGQWGEETETWVHAGNRRRFATRIATSSCSIGASSVWSCRLPRLNA